MQFILWIILNTSIPVFMYAVPRADIEYQLDVTDMPI